MNRDVETSAAEPSRDRLLAWYDRVRRDLPWRRSLDPYAIWVSEIMLQQTQVKKVIPYFEAFMERFPTVEELALSDIDTVLASWSGLGYYRRARQLHRAAQQVHEAGGEMPRTSVELQQLPGIGAYTSAAIASIAFGEVVPVLDGNVERVMARLLACDEDPKKSATRKRFLLELHELLDPSRPGDSNQALMELGATVCRPKSPACLTCPLTHHCRGKLRAEDFPPPRRRRATVEMRLVVAVVEREGRYLFFKRPSAAGLMAGMWELPWVDASADSTDVAPDIPPGIPTSVPELSIPEVLAAHYGGRWTLGEALGSVKHGITHRSITAVAHCATIESGESVAEGPEAAWLARDEIGRQSAVSSGDMKSYATSSLVDKIFKLIF